MDEKKLTWEQEVIVRCLVITVISAGIAAISAVLGMVTGLGCFMPIAAIGFICAVAFGIFGTVGLVVEGI